MLKQLFMLFGVLSVQAYASSGVEDSNVNKREATEEVKLDDYPYGVADEIKNSKDGPVEGQRQKRFFDYGLGYAAAGSSSFSSNLPSVSTFAWSGPPGTDTPDEQYKLNEILKRVKNLADITKRQYLPPINRPIMQYPSFIPYFVPPQFRCTCPQVNKPVNRPQPAPQTTITPPSTESTPSTVNTEKPATTKVPESFGNRDFNVSSPGLITNDDFPDDYEDGVRPISFEPITPKVPMGVEPPPVEHGSFQAGLNTNPTEFNSPGTAASQTFSSSKFPTVEITIPTICDGAILACCHKNEVTNACFVKEGCGDIDYDNPCDPSVLSVVISKFRSYINQRNG